MTSLRRLWAPVLGIVLVVVGGLLVATPRAIVSFGWTASSPLSGTSYSPGLAIDGPYLAGALCFGAGALLLAGWVGYLLGRRSSRA